MNKIAIILRTLQLYGQNLHNLVSGSSFFADHNALSDFYVTAASDYDSVVERMIGLGMEIDLVQITVKASDHVKKLPIPDSNEKAMELILALEKQLCKEVQSEVKKEISEGTKQLIGEIANKSEGRQYLISQRLK